MAFSANQGIRERAMYGIDPRLADDCNYEKEVKLAIEGHISQIAENKEEEHKGISKAYVMHLVDMELYKHFGFNVWRDYDEAYPGPIRLESTRLGHGINYIFGTCTASRRSHYAMSRNRCEPRPYAGSNYSASDSDATASDSWALVMAHPGDHVGGSTASYARASDNRAMVVARQKGQVNGSAASNGRASSTRAMAVAHRGGHVNGSTAFHARAPYNRDMMLLGQGDYSNGSTASYTSAYSTSANNTSAYNTRDTISNDVNDALYRATISRRLAMRQLIVNADATMKAGYEFWYENDLVP
ncbi:hypothetical protein B0T26DRAFT_745060 [Lasiosphaeria miniovina]|uniref:Uncharacterized protein n=1 Tax=Lasiosphaeria miniovina TaxID=1954250 RepID=A0AA40BEV5_9PEZI|nr:uncharacterized protein B0T26DRAFT_745060 [Lasiosphaeria miniovina]KAK0732960.1 hypothetical protein B0T26DRAFT_745060 [Lasiosphaeria miniovina]